MLLGRIGTPQTMEYPQFFQAAMYEGAESTRADHESPSKKSMAKPGCALMDFPNALTVAGDW